MPLHDHFAPPLSVQRPWEGFHSVWATKIAEDLNENLLPAAYVAIPHVRQGTALEVDVGGFQESQTTAAVNTEDGTQPWSPAEPVWSGLLEWPERDLFEVRIIEPAAGPRLVAAIELVSPANKDRPAHREAFAGKCASYLRQGISLMLIDVVTTRHENLHQRLLDLLELNAPAAFTADLYATAYRTREQHQEQQLDFWTEPLILGAELPTLPLWLTEELAIPVNLETSYVKACRMLRLS